MGSVLQLVWMKWGKLWKDCDKLQELKKIIVKCYHHFHHHDHQTGPRRQGQNMCLWKSWLLCVDFCDTDRTLVGKAKRDFWTAEWMVGKGKADALSWVGFLYSFEDLGINKRGNIFCLMVWDGTLGLSHLWTQDRNTGSSRVLKLSVFKLKLKSFLSWVSGFWTQTGSVNNHWLFWVSLSRSWNVFSLHNFMIQFVFYLSIYMVVYLSSYLSVDNPGCKLMYKVFEFQ